MCTTTLAHPRLSAVVPPTLWLSDVGGASWAPVPRTPLQHRPMRAALAADGMLYLAMASEPGPHRMKGGSVWALDTVTGRWADITPEAPTEARPFGYATVAVDPRQPRRL